MQEEPNPRTKDGNDMSVTAGRLRDERAEGLQIPATHPPIRLQDKLLPRQGWLHWLRCGRLTLMAEKPDGEQQRLSIPYPILALIVGVFMWLAGITGGGLYLIGQMTANVNQLNTTLVLRDAQMREDQRRRDEQMDKRLDKLSEESEINRTYITGLREKMAEYTGAQRGGGN